MSIIILIGITCVLGIAYLKSQITSEAARLVNSALFIRNLIRGIRRGHYIVSLFFRCAHGGIILVYFQENGGRAFSGILRAVVPIQKRPHCSELKSVSMKIIDKNKNIALCLICVFQSSRD